MRKPLLIIALFSLLFTLPVQKANAIGFGIAFVYYKMELRPGESGTFGQISFDHSNWYGWYRVRFNVQARFDGEARISYSISGLDPLQVLLDPPSPIEHSPEFTIRDVYVTVQVPLNCPMGIYYGDLHGGLAPIGGGISISGNIPRYLTVIVSGIATINIDPDALNLESKGKWITVYIQLPEGNDPEAIDASTISLNQTLHPVLDSTFSFVTNSSEYLVDNNEDGILERMVKFDRAELMTLLSVGEATLTITGEINGTSFEGCDTIRVLNG